MKLKLLTGILVSISVFAVVIFSLIMVKEVKNSGGKWSQGSMTDANADGDEESKGNSGTKEDMLEDTEGTEGQNGIWDDETLWTEGEIEEDEKSDKDSDMVEYNESGSSGMLSSSQGTSGSNQTGSTSQSVAKPASSEEALLNNVYASTTLSQGDIHSHLDNDGRINETTAFEKWKKDISGLGLSFVASLDHNQTNHIENSAWSRNVFLYGTEAEVSISGKKGSGASGLLHYNILFAGNNAATMLRETLASAGMLKSDGTSYDYAYNKSEAWFGDLIKTVQNKGGFFVVPHPSQKRGSAPYAANALGYVFKDSKGNAVNRIGFEVITRSAYESETTKNYGYWKQLLNAGYKYYACAGSDIHGLSTETGGDGNLLIKKAITSIYTKSSEKTDEGYLRKLKEGNFTAGAVGIQMCVGNLGSGQAVAMGGECNFKGQKLVVKIGQFYNYLNQNAQYRVEIHTEDGVVKKQNITPSENAVIVLDTDEKAKYYRVEVRYAEGGTCIAYGNPIWNTNEVK